jgi:glutaredoxin
MFAATNAKYLRNDYLLAAIPRVGVTVGTDNISAKIWSVRDMGCYLSKVALRTIKQHGIGIAYVIVANGSSLAEENYVKEKRRTADVRQHVESDIAVNSLNQATEAGCLLSLRKCE